MNKYLLIYYNNILLRILFKMNSNNTLKRTIKLEEDNSPKKIKSEDNISPKRRGRKPKSHIHETTPNSNESSPIIHEINESLPNMLHKCRVCLEQTNTELRALCYRCFSDAKLTNIQDRYVFNINETTQTNQVVDIEVSDSFIDETYDLLEPHEKILKKSKFNDNMAYFINDKTFFDSLIKNDMISVCMVDNKPTIKFHYSIMNKQRKEIIQQILFNRDSLCDMYNLSYTDELIYTELKECFNDYIIEPLFTKYGLKKHDVQLFTFDIEPLPL